MSEKTTYYVMREHLGDKDYVRGETRELRSEDAVHLLRLGVLSETPPEGKAKPRPEGKAKNKA